MLKLSENLLFAFGIVGLILTIYGTVNIFKICKAIEEDMRNLFK